MGKRILSGLLIAILAVGCDSGGGGDDARVRLIQTSTMGQPLTLFIDQDLIETLNYGEVGSYDNTDPGIRTLRGVVGATEVFSMQAILDDDIDYSLVTVQEGSNVTPVLLVDDNSTPDVGNFDIRGINASSRAQSVDIYVLRENDSVVDHQPNFSSLQFKTSSNYDQIDRTEWVIWATLPGTKTVIAQAPSQEFESGETWSVIVQDDPNGAGVVLGLNQDRDGDEFNF